MGYEGHHGHNRALMGNGDPPDEYPEADFARFSRVLVSAADRPEADDGGSCRRDANFERIFSLKKVAVRPSRVLKPLYSLN
jgi:hypothetical protein